MRPVASLALGLGVLIAWPTRAPGQGVIAGLAREDSSLRPLQGVEIVLSGQNRQTTTNSAGRFRIDRLPGGQYSVLFRLVGYRPTVRTALVGAPDSVFLDITMKPYVQELQPVDVSSSAVVPRGMGLRESFGERRRLGFGKFIDSTALRGHEQRRVADVLRSVPGVLLEWINPCGRGQRCAPELRAVSGRKVGASREPCYYSLVYDGRPFYRSGSADGGLTPPDFSREFWVSELEAIEVYRSAGEIPMEFEGSAGACGVIVMWSRRGGPVGDAPRSVAEGSPSAAPISPPAKRSPPFDLRIAIGMALGGPPSAMKAHLDAQGWSAAGSNPPVSFSTTMTWELSRFLQVGGVVGVSRFGQVTGQRGEYEVLANWSAIHLGPSLWIRPHRLVRLGGGALLSVMSTSTATSVPQNVFLPGFLVGADLRSTAKPGLFFEATASYRRLAGHTEGPWVGRNRRVPAVIDPGFGPPPGSFQYSYTFLGLGLGWRF